VIMLRQILGYLFRSTTTVPPEREELFIFF
jgi:hypothetical protein